MRNAMRALSFMIVAILLYCPEVSAVTPLNNYCITPPFIQEATLPNLLLIIDNSASMYDLAYTDTGRKTCSGTTTTYCNTDTDCPSGQTCSNFTRQPYYCFDMTFNSSKNYVGYFDVAKLYSYDFTAKEFVEDSTGFSCAASGTDTAKSISGHLCVIYTAANVATTFKASGRYLNWLTASKFDVQKKLLTGGKYDGSYLLPESRGCVGQSFVKKAITADFVNYNSPETNNTNTSLSIAFGIRGPFDTVNPSAPSPGGQTYLDVYKGDYNQGICQDAVTAIVSGTNAEIKQNVGACLATTSATTPVTKAKVTFQQSMQACWQYRNTTPHTVGHDDIVTVTNQCPDIYTVYGTCSNDPKKVCTTATVATDCGAANSCIYGPAAIVPGNPALLCGNEYEGQYYYYQAAGTKNVCAIAGTACTTNADCPNTYKQCKKTTNYCTTDADCTGSGNSCSKTVTDSCNSTAVSAGWQLIPGVTETQMIATHNQFCSDMTATPVIDPTNAPSDTALYNNVPAILTGVGVEAQLNQPIGSLSVKLRKSAAPSGYVHEFSNQVRIGAMTFNRAGSATEVSAGILTAPMVCSNDTTKSCTLNIDCVSPGTCQALSATTTPSNLDGAKIVSYISGVCSATSTTVCYSDAQCPSGETCNNGGVGTYASGLVHDLNYIPAQSWTPFAEAFYNAIGYFAKDPTTGRSRTDLRLNSTDFDENKNPSQYRCQSNNILLITDGTSTADRNPTVDNLAKLYTAAGGATSWTTGTGACPSYGGSVNLDNMAWIGRNLNITNFSTTTASPAVATANKQQNEYITTYVVFNGDSNGLSGECNSKTLLSQTAVNGGTTLYQAIDPASLDTALRDAFKAIAAGSASGTAASILSNSEGSGATLLQALFYPQKEFDKTSDSDTFTTSANWIGELQSYWYYLDPYLQKTSIREDTVADYKLNLKSDKVVQFYFDPVAKKTLVNKYSDLNGDGAADSTTPDAGAAGLSPDVINSLWKAGRKLWARDVTTVSGARTIYTGYNSVSGSTPKLFSNTADFNDLTTDRPDVWNILQIPDTLAATDRKAKATKLVNYVFGIDQPVDTDGTAYRNRKVTIRSYCAAGAISFSACTKEWKLGDIVSSTPKIASTNRLNNYNLAPPTGYNDTSYGKFTTSSAYTSRGMAFVGANDGMLHAFRLGILKELSGTYDKAKIVNSDGSNATSSSDLGREEWAFIPTNALPYLTYLSDPNYSHLFYVDKSPLLVDASIVKSATCTAGDYSECDKSSDGSTWRSILIGGMGFGGAARSQGTTGAVTTPVLITNADGTTTQYGYSSYFALDVTDPANPKYMWEFDGGPSHLLGYSTTGPAIVRVAAKKKNADGTYSTSPDNTKNGKWFAIFASGPLGPIDTIKHAFLGESTDRLKIFIVDLASGQLVKTLDAYELTGDSGFLNAFAGSLSSSVIDTDRSNQASSGYYSDDAVYIGYVQKDTSFPSTCDAQGHKCWNKGGVLRLTTKESTNPNDPDLTKQWSLSKLIDDVGPVTTSITKLQDRQNNKLWIYFGTGRFYYKGDDQSNTRQAIYGLIEPCYTTSNTISKDCTTKVTGAIKDQSGDSSAPAATLDSSTPGGWKILLDSRDDTNGYLTERIITDPVASPAGAVFFTSFKPSGDRCNYGGNSLLWAVRYDTGAAPPASSMQGKALMQVSTGAFAEIKLSEAFKNPGSTRYDSRRLATPITGVPPTAQGLSLFSNPPPVKKLLHIREK